MLELLGLPVSASEHAWQIDRVLILIHIVVIAAFVTWGAFFIIPLVRYRKRVHPKADYQGLRTRVPYYGVAALALAEVVLLLGFSLPFWEGEVRAMPTPSASEVQIQITAEQFKWHIHYPGSDGIFGRTDAALVNTQTNPLGIDSEDPNSSDDITTQNQLYLPVNRQVIIELRSRDVIHSLNLPQFRIKQDAIPGMAIPVHFIPTMTTAEFRETTGDATRNFEIACAQLCGANHYYMRGTVVVGTDGEYTAWYEEQLEAKRAAQVDADWF